VKNPEFYNPQRQSVKGIVLFFFQAIRIFFKTFWPLVLVFIVNNEELAEVLPYVYLGVGILAAIFITHSVLHYLYFYFQFTENEFVITKGYLKKVRIAIPYERIQSVNSKQNVFQQLLKVQTIEIDTAGSSKKEVQLIAIDSETAILLQEQLSSRKRTGTPAETNGEPELIVQPEPERKLILKLDVGDLIKIGISENHLKSALLLLVLISGFIQQIQDVSKDFLANYEDDVKSYMLQAGALMIAFIILFFLIVGTIYSMLRVILVYFNLSFYKVNDHFQLKQGLLNKKEWTIPYSKIQVFVWGTNPLRKIMDFVTLQFVLAASSNYDKKQSILVPGVSSTKREHVMNEIFGVTQVDAHVQFKPRNIFFIRYFLLFGLFPAAVASFFFYNDVIFQILGPAWVLLFMSIAILKRKKRELRLSEEHIEFVKGIVGEQVAVLKQYKVQSIKFRQSIFQQWRGSASIVLYTAGGFSIHIPYMEYVDAVGLYNLLLFKVENSREAWM